ncbi:MAG: response regulator [Gammaproteobacteria bacterium]
MAIKKALIVDDSKSARLVLERMLKEFALNVDSVESAIDALKYLESQQPDVIFMDHMMPGMDGFEAIKHIKINPDTALIPIMMYTSRSGDVYLSQARELGAVGIIPKTISPVGLKQSLFKLGLIDDRRIESTLVADEPVTADTNKQVIKENIITQHSDHGTFLDELQKLMDDQTVELHKSMWLGVESVSHEIFNRLNSELGKQFEKTQLALQANNKTSWQLYIVSALLVLSIVFNVRLLSDNHQLEKNLLATNIKQTFAPDEKIAEENLPDRLEAVLPDKQEALLPDNQEVLKEFVAWAHNMVIEYPFDELALNDKRLPYIEALVKKALKAEYTGNIILQTHVGRFCMSRDSTGIFKLADDKLSITQCEYIGNNFQPSDAPSAHQSLSFANHLSEINSLNKKSVALEVANISRTFEISAYPQITPQTKVKEWNLAAKLNNRITVKLEAAPTESELNAQ